MPPCPQQPCAEGRACCRGAGACHHRCRGKKLRWQFASAPLLGVETGPEARVPRLSRLPLADVGLMLQSCCSNPFGFGANPGGGGRGGSAIRGGNDDIIGLRGWSDDYYDSAISCKAARASGGHSTATAVLLSFVFSITVPIPAAVHSQALVGTS